MPVTHHTVAGDEAGLRVDRWFKRHFPSLGHGKLEKLLRTGQVRVDGGRVKAGQRLEAGQSIRVPPIDAGTTADRPAPKRPTISAADAADLKSWVLWQDDQAIVINKPPGLPVQGGTKSARNLDAMLDALANDKGVRPKLVHRLDKDTSGVLLLARTASAAAALAGAFRHKTARKLYWALVVGTPHRRRGRIDAALAKRGSAGGEKVVLADSPEAEDDDDVKNAASRYVVVDHAGNQVSWLAMMPLTGRTHQLRVHAAALGTPIVGDGKYGGKEAFLTGRGVSNRLHLHARRLIVPRPGGGMIDVTAPLPDHMRRSWEMLGFDPNEDGDPFELDEGR